MLHNVVRPIDLWLLKKIFESLSRWLGNRIGVSGYVVAKLLFMAAGFLTLATILLFVYAFTLNLRGEHNVVYILSLGINTTICSVQVLLGIRLARVLEKNRIRLASMSHRLQLDDGTNLFVAWRRCCLFFVLFSFFGSLPFILLDVLLTGVLRINLVPIPVNLGLIFSLVGYYLLSCKPTLPEFRTQKEKGIKSSMILAAQH